MVYLRDHLVEVVGADLPAALVGPPYVALRLASLLGGVEGEAIQFANLASWFSAHARGASAVLRLWMQPHIDCLTRDYGCGFLGAGQLSPAKVLVDLHNSASTSTAWASHAPICSQPSSFTAAPRPSDQVTSWNHRRDLGVLMLTIVRSPPVGFPHHGGQVSAPSHPQAMGAISLTVSLSNP
jgi:hypothetical protein